jgi:hypothetical protein
MDTDFFAWTAATVKYDKRCMEYNPNASRVLSGILGTYSSLE